jgi:hypothetical protein
MPGRISDEVLNTYATIGTYDEIGSKLVERYGGLVTDIEFSIPCTDDKERSVMRDLLAQLKSERR